MAKSERSLQVTSGKGPSGIKATEVGPPASDKMLLSERSTEEERAGEAKP